MHVHASLQGWRAYAVVTKQQRSLQSAAAQLTRLLAEAPGTRAHKGNTGQPHTGQVFAHTHPVAFRAQLLLYSCFRFCNLVFSLS